jgi:hypothetical protein
MYGLLAETRDYVEAVFSEPERPPRSPIRGLSARWRGRFGQGPAFRSSERSEAAGELEIDFRTLGPKQVLASLASIGAVLFVAWTFFRIGFHAWLLLPSALVAIVAYLLLGRLRMRSRLKVAEGVLEYTGVGHGFLGTSVRQVPVRDIRQLYVTHLPETNSSPAYYELRVRTRSGDGIVLETFVSPDLALLFESLAERALGIEDQPEAEELDRRVPIKRATGVYAPILIALAVVCGITAIAVESSSGTLQPVALEESPREQELPLRFPMTLTFEAELAFSRREPPAAAFPSIEGTPPSAMVFLEVERDGLACDPHQLTDSVIVIDEAGTGRSRYRIRGTMSSCSLRLGAGRHVLRAHAKRLQGASAAGLQSSRLVPRFKRHLF